MRRTSTLLVALACAALPACGSDESEERLDAASLAEALKQRLASENPDIELSEVNCGEQSATTFSCTALTVGEDGILHTDGYDVTLSEDGRSFDYEPAPIGG